jgi:hypothetical protein
MMTGLGIGMAPREFECMLCQKHYTLLCGDLVLPEYLLCDDCLAELQPLEEDELRKHVAENAPRCDQAFVDEIIRIIQGNKKFGPRSITLNVVQEALSE